MPVSLAQMLGARLKVLRVAAGLSQKALGKRVGVTRQVVARAERGGVMPTLRTLLDYAESLDAPLLVMLGPACDALVTAQIVERWLDDPVLLGCCLDNADDRRHVAQKLTDKINRLTSVAP